MTKTEHLIWRLATLVPAKVRTAPERLLINSVCVLIGLAGLVAVRPGSLLELWPRWFAYWWAGLILFGGAMALAGILRERRAPERIGVAAIMVAALIYGVATLIVFGTAAIFSSCMWLGIAAAKAIRLIVSLAARDQTIRSGEEREGVR